MQASSTEPRTPAPADTALATQERADNRPAPTTTGGSSRRARGFLLAAAVVVLVLLAVGIVPRLRRGQELSQAARAEQEIVPSVTVAVPKQSPDALTLTLPGDVEAAQTTPVNARTSGYVRRFLVDIGDRVRAGQVLAEIESPEVDQEARQARAELAQSQAAVAQARAEQERARASLAQFRAQVARARANVARAAQSVNQQQAQVVEARAGLELARISRDRWRLLAREGAVGRQEADEREAAYNTSRARANAVVAGLDASRADVTALRAGAQASEADVNAAQANLEASRANINAAQAGVSASQANVARFGVLRSFQQVRAPFDGIITARTVEEGSLVGAGATASANTRNTSAGASGTAGLFTIARIDTLRINVNVPQTEAGAIRAGQRAQITVRELPDRTFDGRIVRNASALDPTSRTLRAEVGLDNRDGVLLPGMYAQVQVDVVRADPPLLVPASALITRGEGTQLATVNRERRVQYRQIVVGRDFGREVEIVSGLDANAQVVVNPTDALREGATVKAQVQREEARGSGAGQGPPGQPPTGAPSGAPR